MNEVALASKTEVAHWGLTFKRVSFEPRYTHFQVFLQYNPGGGCRIHKCPFLISVYGHLAESLKKCWERKGIVQHYFVLVKVHTVVSMRAEDIVPLYRQCPFQCEFQPTQMCWRQRLETVELCQRREAVIEHKHAAQCTVSHVKMLFFLDFYFTAHHKSRPNTSHPEVSELWVFYDGLRGDWEIGWLALIPWRSPCCLCVFVEQASDCSQNCGLDRVWNTSHCCCSEIHNRNSLLCAECLLMGCVERVFFQKCSSAVCCGIYATPVWKCPHPVLYGTDMNQSWSAESIWSVNILFVQRLTYGIASHSLQLIVLG